MTHASSEIETRVRALGEELRRRGLSLTHQRLAIYRCLLEDESHPDAEKLYEKVRMQLPSISLGTVYKTLDTLKDLGVVHEVDAPRSATRYEAVVEPHHHLICERCGQIIDLHEPALSSLTPPPTSGFEVTHCTVQFRGRCRKCAEPVEPSPIVQRKRRPRTRRNRGG